MYLEGIEFESIWNLAHKWLNRDPNESSVENLNGEVRERIQRIARAAISAKFPLRYKKNPILESHALINMLFDWHVFWPLRATYHYDKLNEPLLKALYVPRAEILRWCENDYLDPPAYWMPNHSAASDSDKSKDHQQSKRAKATIAWQTFAQSMWMIDPKIHPKHMAESEYFRSLDKDYIYGIETVKGWIADLDPQLGQRNGRPQSIEYIVDLKSGGLNKKATLTFKEK